MNVLLVLFVSCLFAKAEVENGTVSKYGQSTNVDFKDATTETSSSIRNNVTRTSASSPSDLHSNCTCVPYYRCKDDQDEYVIDINGADNRCSHYLERCCKNIDVETPNPDKKDVNFEHPTTETSSSKVDNVIRTSASSPGDLHPNCTCVPYYRCKDDQEEYVIDIHVPHNTCSDYLERCCKNIIDVATTKPDKKDVRCGKRNVMNNLTKPNDNEAMIGEFPWMVALLQTITVKKETPEMNEINHCGASLIHPQVVLTAAHCVYNKTESYIIRAGEWDTRTTNELFPHQDRKIKDTIIHPKFNNGPLFYDFALLILESPLEITSTVDVVCLPSQNMVSENLSCYATGWGREVFSAEVPNTAILKKIGLPIVDRDTCQTQLRKTRLGPYFKLHESFICAGGEVGKDTCKGDGGGPLVCPIPGEEDKFYQAGIVAWGINCGKDFPAVYADVVKVINWIDEVMISYQFDTSIYRY